MKIIIDKFSQENLIKIQKILKTVLNESEFWHGIETDGPVFIPLESFEKEGISRLNVNLLFNKMRELDEDIPSFLGTAFTAKTDKKEEYIMFPTKDLSQLKSFKRSIDKKIKNIYPATDVIKQGEGLLKEAGKNILTYKKIKFYLESGDVFYNKTKANFKPDDDGYRVLKALMERPEKRLSYDEINKALEKNENSKKDRSDIAFIIRNIKNKLGIGTKNKKGNKNLFKACNGYKII